MMLPGPSGRDCMAQLLAVLPLSILDGFTTFLTFVENAVNPPWENERRE